MRTRLVVYGLLAMVLVLSTFTSFSINSEREDTEMVVIVNPRNPLNPVVENPYQDEYEQMLYPVVRITSDSGTGTGVIISNTNDTNKDEWTRIVILTAAHVVEDETTVNVELYNAGIITGTVVITDTDKDLALIRVINPPDPLPTGRQAFDKGGSKGGFYSARLAPESYIAYLFTPIYTVGCSLGLTPRPSAGIISVVEPDHWEVTSPILPGNSGGPVYAKRSGVPSDDGNAYEYQVIGIAIWVKVYRAYLPTGQAGRQAGDGQLITTMAGIVPINQIHEFINRKE